MKPITKFCLILCAILTAIGLTGIGASIAMGVKPVQLLNLAHYSENLLESNFLQAEEYYEFSDIDCLDFDFTVCNLNIQSHKQDFISLDAANVKDTFQCNIEDNKLILKDERNYPKKGQDPNTDYALKLTLYVPDQIFQKIDIINGSGDITIDQLSAKHLNIESGVGTFTASRLSGDDTKVDIGSGNITIDTLSGKDTSIDVGVGNVQVDDTSISGKLYIDSGTGNITLNRYEGENLNLNCGLANVSVLAVGKESNYNYELDCGMGELYLNNKLQKTESSNKDLDGINNSLKVQNNSDKDIYIDCALGSLELNFTEE